MSTVGLPDPAGAAIFVSARRARAAQHHGRACPTKFVNVIDSSFYFSLILIIKLQSSNSKTKSAKTVGF